MPEPLDQRPDRRAITIWKCLARRLLLVGSALLGFGLTTCYIARPDACAAITIIPVGAWLVPGLLLTVFDLRGRGNRRGWFVVAGWLVFLMAMAEEPASLARALFPVRPSAFWRSHSVVGDEIRVVTLNCAIGNRLAAAEVARCRPDIVLLQESPGRSEVETLARGLFGTEAGVVYGVDASLISRWQVVPTDLPPPLRSYFVQARLTLGSGREIEVFSTRLLPAVFRADLWSPDCWQEQAENRRRRREEIREIARRAASCDVPVIVGGDFNAPQGDAVFRLLQPKLRDTFANGGVGWGNTIINDFPVLRIDQIWASGSLATRAVATRKTVNSDHRIVVCDLEWVQ